MARVSASFRVPESIAVAGDTLRSGRAITVLPRVARSRPPPAGASSSPRATPRTSASTTSPRTARRSAGRASARSTRRTAGRACSGRDWTTTARRPTGSTAAATVPTTAARPGATSPGATTSPRSRGRTAPGFYGYDRGTGRIGVSGDRGASWAPYYTTNVDLAAGRPEVWLDPTDDTRVYTVEQTGGRRDFCLLKGASAPAKVSMGLFAAMQAGAGRTPAAYGPTELAVDPFDPRRVYAQLRTHGNPWMWRGRWDAGFTAIEWEDVTRNLPRTTQNTCLAISPWTGDIFCGRRTASTCWRRRMATRRPTVSATRSTTPCRSPGPTAGGACRGAPRRSPTIPAAASRVRRSGPLRRER